MNNDMMNFLPEDYIERRIERRTNMICVSMFVVVLLGLIGAFVVSDRHRQSVRHQQVQVNDEYTEAAKKLEQLTSLEGSKQQMLDKARLTGALLEPVPRTFLFAELINRMPSTLSLFDCVMETKKVPVKRAPVGAKTALGAKAAAKPTDGKAAATAAKPGAKPGESKEAAPETTVRIALTGVAPTDEQVAQYISRLQDSPLLKDVNLMYSEEMVIDTQLMRKFMVEMYLNPASDVRDFEPLAISRKIRNNPLTGKPSNAGPPAPGVKGGASAAVDEDDTTDEKGE